MKVGILGAGPAGLTAAVALQRYAPPGSVDITVLDRYNSTADYPGVEYGIQARAMRALHRVRADDAARRRGNPVDRIEFYKRHGHRQLALRVDPRWSIGVMRREFLADLASLSAAPLLRGHDVNAITAADGGRRVEVTFADGQPARRFDLLVAADGVQSVARRQFFPDDAVTHDRGFSSIYLLVDATNAPDGNMPPGFSSIANGRTIRFMRGSFATAAWFPAGNGRLTLALGFDHATRAQIWVSQGLPHDAAWQNLPGAQRRSLARRIAADVPGPGGLVLQALDLVEDWVSPDVYLWSMRDSDPLAQPYTAGLPVVLLGDAAHAFLPTIGMGASLAIEDAEIFSGILARHLAGGGSPDGLHTKVLQRFGDQRRGVWLDLMTRARDAVTNWRHETVEQGFVLSPFVPTRVGSALGRGYEQLRGRKLTPTDHAA
ncbi:FAD-dependent oxidoreductase [Arthrobacter sp. TMN-37]